MEAEVVRMAANLFHGSEKACGTVMNITTFKQLVLEITFHVIADDYRWYRINSHGLQGNERLRQRSKGNNET